MKEILIEEQLGFDRADEPLLGGIPVARGELQHGGWFDLQRDDGENFVVEGTPAAWWPDGSVKWLHLCGLLNLASGRTNRFSLAPAVSAPQGKLEVQRVTAHDVRVNGGAITVRVRGDVLELLGAWDGASGHELLVPPGLSLQYQLTDPEQQGYRACRFELTGDPVDVVVETANRVVLRVAGRFLDQGQREVALVRLFVEVWREVAQIRLQPVLIPVGIPNEELIRKFDLRVHSAIRAGDRKYAFADAQGQGQWDVMRPHAALGPRWPLARQLQLGSSFYKTEKRTWPQGRWVKSVESDRAQGWCHLANETGGVTAAMRYYWQEYPHSLSIDADAGTLTFGLIPQEAEPLDLRRYSPTVCGGGSPDVTMYETGSGPDEPHRSTASGIAKAHELAILFHVPNDRDIARQALSFLRPSRPIVPAEAFVASGVLGHIAPLATDRSNAAEMAVTRIMDFLIKERDARGWYGLMDFGDIMLSYYSELDRWAYDDGGHAWLNTEALPDYGMWLSALRGQRIDWLEAAIEMSRHNRDVDMYHWGPFKAMGTRHNVNHWGDRDKEWRVSMPIAKRLHYYTTADAWTREVILETTKIFQSTERTTKNAPGLTGAFAGILAKWEMSGDPVDARTIANLADLYASAVREDGRIIQDFHVNFATGLGETVGPDLSPGQSFFMDNFGGQHVLTEVAELIDHAGLKDAIVRHAAFRILRPDGDAMSDAVNAVEFLAVAHRRTGEARYQEVLQRMLAGASFQTEWIGSEHILDAPPHERDPKPTRRNKYVCGLGWLLIHVPFARAETP